MKYYTGNITNTPETIAVLPRPYYWWEAGAMWGAMVDYYHLTGDTSYNDVTYEALLSQVGPAYDYMVPIRQKEEGNDDQAFWGFATMAAAEYDWTPPPAPIPSWLQLTINLWETQVARWDTAACGGGLRWQIFSFNNGYEYKNAVSNAAFFQLSARLARFTGNSTYVKWAEKTWDWSEGIGLIGSNFEVHDGADRKDNCQKPNLIEWSYNSGLFMYGAAAMYNITEGSTRQIWKNRVQGLLDHANYVFFRDGGVMWEIACEGVNTCNYDQWSFKAYLSRFMWATTKLAPFTYTTIRKSLITSAQAAAKQCTGGPDGEECGAKWYVSKNDGIFGPGQQMAALETIQGLLIDTVVEPDTADAVPDVGVPVSPNVISTIATVSPSPQAGKGSGAGSLAPELKSVGAVVVPVAALWWLL
jgi:mannan endo-1,6-alpha-mannosidase